MGEKEEEYTNVRATSFAHYLTSKYKSKKCRISQPGNPPTHQKTNKKINKETNLRIIVK